MSDHDYGWRPYVSVATLGLEGRGSCVASSRRSRPVVSAGATRWAEVMTPRGVRALSRPAVTLEWSAWVVTRGRVFHQVGPFEFVDTTRARA